MAGEGRCGDIPITVPDGDGAGGVMALDPGADPARKGEGELLAFELVLDLGPRGGRDQWVFMVEAATATTTSRRHSADPPSRSSGC